MYIKVDYRETERTVLSDEKGYYVLNRTTVTVFWRPQVRVSARQTESFMVSKLDSVGVAAKCNPSSSK